MFFLTYLVFCENDTFPLKLRFLTFGEITRFVFFLRLKQKIFKNIHTCTCTRVILIMLVMGVVG